MQVGLMALQGWKREYDGWDPAEAWARTIELAEQAETLGFESLWAFDHFHTVPVPADEITFESFSVLAALAMVTKRMRLGHMVVCTGFRNPALTAKMASTIDVICGGRFELGIGAGWKEDEWIAYGYGFPTLRERMAALGDHLEVVKRMLEPGRASFEGDYAEVRGAINEPKGLQQPRIPIVVGGNGRNVTFRYAARFAEELNLVFLVPGRGGRAAADHPAALRGGGSRPRHAPGVALHARPGCPRTWPGTGRLPRGAGRPGAGPGRLLPDPLEPHGRGAGAVRGGLCRGRTQPRRLSWAELRPNISPGD